MHFYSEVTTQSEMNQLIDSMADYYDCLVKEVCIANRGYILANGHAVTPARMDLQVLIQLEKQKLSGAIELVFIDVAKCSFTSGIDKHQSVGIVQRTKLKTSDAEDVQIEVKLCESLEILSKRFFYRFRNDWLGPKAYLTSEVPSPDAITAKVLDADWRQCSNCSGAWEDRLEHEFSVCPTCHQLTELQSPNSPITHSPNASLPH